MSRLPFELLLALRYLRPKRTFVSIITLISVAGVALGVAVLIIVISVMSGFDKQMRDKILGFNAHMKVVRADGSMPDYESVMAVVASNRNALKKYYIYHDRQYWHMTPNGNWYAANLLSTQLQDWLQPPPAATAE